MNKKIFLSALALPAVFAACTQEDVMEMNNTTVQGRVALEEVTFENMIDSRFAFDGSSFNSYVAKSGDAVGAYLIDTPNGIKTDAELDAKKAVENVTEWDVESYLLGGYTPATSIQGSFKWVYDGSTFTTLDKMVEGQYLYVAPYQEKATREPITTAIPQVMQLEYKEGTTELNDNSLLDALAASGTPVAVGYEFLSRYDSNVNGQLKQIYAYPRVTFKNMLEEAVTIQKIVINSASKIALKGTIKISETGEGNDAIDVLKRYDSDTEDAHSGNWIKAKAGNWYKTANYTADIIAPDNDSKVDFLVVMAPENYSVGAGKTMAFQAVLPAAEYNDLVVDVYTNKGIFRATLGAGLKFNNGLRYSSANYKDGSLKAEVAPDANGIGGFTRGSDVAVAKTTTTTVNPVVVVDTDDLIAVINGAAEGTVAEPKKIDIAPVNTVVINEKVAAALGAKKGLNVTELVTVEGTLNGYTLKNVLFEAGAKVASGKLTLGTGAKVKGTNTLEIAANATVILDEVLNANGNAQIANKGTLNINKVQTVKNLTNEGTLTINKIMVGEVVGEVVLNNLNNGAAATTSANLIIADGAKAKVTALSGYGDVTINANATADLAGASNGEITNNGTFKCTTAQFVSNGTFNNNSALNGSSNFVNDGTFYNNYTSGVVTIAQNGVTTDVDSDFDASAVIIPVAKSMTKVNHNYGTIKYVDGALLAETKNHGVQGGKKYRYGHVEYTFDGSDSEALNAAFPTSYATKVVLTKNFEIKEGKSITVEEIKCIEAKGGIITVNEDQVLYNCPLFVAGDVTLAGKKAILTNDRVVVDQTAVLTIFGGTFRGYEASLNSYDKWMTFLNYGTVNNFGKVIGANDLSEKNIVTGTWTAVWEGNDFDVVD